MEKIFSRRGFSLYVLLIDLLIIYLSIYISYIIFKNSLIAYEDNVSAVVSMLPYTGLFYLIIGHIFELDKPKEFTLFGIAYPVILSVLCLSLLTMAMNFLTGKLAYPRSILITSSFLQVILLTTWHFFINKSYLNNNKKKTILVIGYDKAKGLAKKLLEQKAMWSNINMICSPKSGNLYNHIKKSDIIFMADDVREDLKQDIAEICVYQNKEFFYAPKYQEIFLFNANFVRVEDTPVLRTRLFYIDPGSESIKRFVDILITSVAGIILFIPTILIALILKLGGGSAFYRQERVTKGGRSFIIYKFRTMVENAEALSGPVLAHEADNRITKIGHILRATRLDEIPQLYNIFVGDMSIVGPRPERPFFVEQFKKEIPEYDLRHRTKAGLTGLAQVQGKYNTSVHDKLKYDLLYINNYSIILDIKLMMQTLTILLKKSSTEGVKDTDRYDAYIETIIEKEEI